MKKFLFLFFFISRTFVLWAQVQLPPAVIVESKHSTFYAEPGITAAYAMDSSVVQAEAVPGGFKLTGKMPGETTVILAALAGVRTLVVTVPEPLQQSGVNTLGSGTPGQTVQFGEYEFRYNNNPNQIGNVENVTQIVGERQIHVEIMNNDIYPAQGQSAVGFPVVTYEISRPRQRITFLDSMMNNTDLTMSGILLRGFHLQQGPWEFHAGITSVTEFQDFLLPSNRYEVAGMSRHFVLNPRSSFEGNFYYFKTDTTVNTDATPGGLATLFYQYFRGEHLKASAEVGVGNGFATAGKVDEDSGTHQLHADFHYQSPHIASLGINELHGRTADLSWNGNFKKRFQVQVFASDTDINLAMEKQEIDAFTLTQTYWINPHFGVTAGLTGSHFVSQIPYAPSLSSAGYLAGPEFLWKHFGGSVEFQELRNSGTTPDSFNYQMNVQASTAHVSVSAFYDSQTETPVFAPVQSAQLNLRDVLRHQSELALTPAQMGQFFRETSSLSSQDDMQPVTVAVATQRTQYGATLDWSNERIGHVALNGIVNTSSGGSVPSLRLTTGGVTWTRKVGKTNVLNAGFSMYHSVSGGQGGSTEPVLQFSLQHQLHSIPRWLVPGRRGTIQGHVFIDKTLAQNYSAGAPPIADVTILVDGHRATQSGKDGYFVIRGVSYGVHRVEAEYHDPRAFYFTSSSPKSVETGATADFGISFAAGHIFGTVTDDTGAGLQATFTLEGNGIQREVSTDGDGNLEVEGLPDGVYQLQPMSSSLPPGYSLAKLQDLSVKVTDQQAGHFHFSVQAQRSIAGKIQIYDSTTGRNSPVAGAEVSIAPGQRTAHTDSEGRYIFRQLPAGPVTVTVQYANKPYSRATQLATVPDIQSNVDVVIPIASPKPVQSSRPVQNTVSGSENHQNR